MNPTDFVHLALLAIGGEIKGSTKLQKTIYFLGVLTNQLENLGYRPHFYGPYSSAVAEAVDQLKSFGFLDQEIKASAVVSEHGFEVCRYDYRLNSDGKAVAASDAKRYGAEWKRLKKAAEVLKDAPSLNYVKLSVAAKTYYLLGEKRGSAKLSELAAQAKDLGWSVSEGEVKEAAKYLNTLGLVKLS